MPLEEEKVYGKYYLASCISVTRKVVQVTMALFYEYWTVIPHPHPQCYQCPNISATATVPGVYAEILKTCCKTV